MRSGGQDLHEMHQYESALSAHDCHWMLIWHYSYKVILYIFCKTLLYNGIVVTSVSLAARPPIAPTSSYDPTPTSRQDIRALS